MPSAKRNETTRTSELDRVPSVDDSQAFVDVPATVVCALCGDPDCVGCAEERSRSGVISIIAWERPGPALSRLWWTARAASENAESFFEALPDGPIAPALRFALLAEMCASASMLAVLASGVAAALLFLGMFPDGASLTLALRIGLVAVFGLTFLLVAAHATHGYALDLGARRVGAPKSPMRALRFGLYASGWDLVLGPVGFFVFLFREGPRAAFRIVSISSRLPTRSSVAFLRGAYQVDDEARAKPALATSYVGAALATVACAVLIVAAVIVASFAAERQRGTG